MSGAMAVIIELGSSKLRLTPEAAAVRGDVTLDPIFFTNQDDPTYNTAQQSLENMRAVTDRLQISTGRNLLHELFYLYAKMDVIQALVRGAAPLYLHYNHVNIVSNYHNGDIPFEAPQVLFSVFTTQ
jgi:hypothetical protein